MEGKDLLIEIGKRIKKKRVQMHITQSDLAKLCGMEKSNMSRLESGKGNPTLITLNKVCEALNTNIADLCSNIEDTAVFNKPINNATQWSGNFPN